MTNPNVAGAQPDNTVRFGIGKRLISAFSVVAALSILVSVVSWYGLEQLSETQNDISSKDVPAITAALELSTETSRLVASAPLLRSATNNEERIARLAQIMQTIEQAKQKIKTLSPLLADQKLITKLNKEINQITPLIERLNETVQQGHEFAAKRNKLGLKLVEMRNTAAKEIKPIVSSATMQVVDNSEGWYNLIESSIEKAKTGSDVDFDTSELEDKALSIMALQKAVAKVENRTNLLIGMLLEASQKETVDGVKKMENDFFATVVTLAAPLGEMGESNDVTKLSALFKELLVLGSKGDLDNNIIKLRFKELELKAEGDELFNQARGISAELSNDVDKIVTVIRANMDSSVEANDQTAKKTLYTLMGVTALSLLIALLIGWLYVLRNLVRRLMLLVRATQKIADGDLTTSVFRDGTDEISRMGMGLAILRNGLRETDKLKQAQEENRLKAEEEKRQNAEKMADDFDTSVGQSLTLLSEYVSDIRVKANSMNDIATQTLSETEEVTSASQTMSENISIVASSAEELSASITQISTQVANSTQVSQEAVQRAETLSRNIESLAEGSKEIESVIGLINTIAEQTNLLALNATIEASRAGEAGKGFAVVASEVKNLANQTASAIDNISELIKSIQDEIEQAVDANGQITNIISEIDGVSADIATAVEQQNAATSEITRTAQSTATQVNTISNRIQEVAGAIQNNTTMVGEVLDGVSHIDDQSTNLTNNVETFLDDIRQNSSTAN